MKTFRNFAEYELDVLQEIGNIGAGHVATALSKMLDNKVEIRIPEVKILPFEAIIDKVGGPEQVVIAVFLRVLGDAPGNMFFIFTQESAKRLMYCTVTPEVIQRHNFSEFERSALTEIGNILAGSYLSSLADFTGLRMSPMVPALAIDMAGAILSFGIIEYGHMGDHALLIDTKFIEGKDEIDGYFFFIPDPTSFGKIFSSLGVPHG